MRTPIACLGILAVGLMVLSAHAQATASAAPKPDQIQKLIELKSYRPALQAIAQIMPKAQGGDKAALLLMRGECLVQLKDSASAVLAFDQAATAAATLPQNEAARAMRLLIGKSPNLMYTPRTGDRTPLDLTDMDARKRAMVALLIEQLPAVTAQADTAVKSNTLPPILAMGPTLRDLHALEVIGTGADIRVTALVQPLGDRIFTLIEAELNSVNQKVQAIQRVASRAVDFGSGSFGIVNGQVQQLPTQGFSGLGGADRQTLRDNIDYLITIGQTCDDLAAVARSFDRDGQRWQELSKQARGIEDFAQSVYDHE